MGVERSPAARFRPARVAIFAILALAGLISLLWVAGVPIPLLPGNERPSASAETAADEIDGEGGDLASEAFRPGLRPPPALLRDPDLEADEAEADATARADAAAALVGIEGVVLRGDGNPAHGARVTAVDGLGFSASADADVAGKFRLDLPPGRYDLILRGGRDGALIVRSFLVETGARAGLSFTLGGAASMRVEVAQDARPLQGAQVRAFLKFDGAQERLAGGTTDLDGSFVADGLPSGPYLVEVEATPGVVFSKSLDVSADVRIPFAIPAPVRVAGYVMDADSRLPLAARIDVGVSLKDGLAVRASAEAGADGGFSVDVPKGRVSWFLAVGPDDYAPYPAPGAQSNSTMQSLRPVIQGQPVTLTVPLKTGAVVAGIVTLEATKEPVPDLALRLQPDAGPARTATTAKDGTYRVAGVGPGNHRMLVETPGWYATTGDRVRVFPAAAGGAPVPFDLRVMSSGVVSGQVVLADGTAVSGARVWLIGGGGAVRGARRAGRELEAYSAADGTFSMDDVPPKVWCRVRAAKGEAEALPGDAFRIADRPPPPQRLVLMATGSIRGRVTDLQTRDAVEAARIRVDPVGEPWGRTGRALASGSEGHYEVAGLLPGRWKLVAQKNGWLSPGVPAEVDLHADSREVDQPLVLDPGFAIGGFVFDATGAPMGGVRLVLAGFEDGQEKAIRPRRGGSDARGAFRWTALRSGSYSLTASRNGFRAVRFDRLRGGEERLRIVMEPAPPPAPAGGR